MSILDIHVTRSEITTHSDHYYKQQKKIRFIEQMMYLVIIIYQIYQLFNEPKFLFVDYNSDQRVHLLHFFHREKQTNDILCGYERIVALTHKNHLYF